jgi:hypothetical protein
MWAEPRGASATKHLLSTETLDMHLACVPVLGMCINELRRLVLLVAFLLLYYHYFRPIVPIYAAAITANLCTAPSQILPAAAAPGGG